MNKLLDYLHLRDVGGLELLMAFYPILATYTIFGLPLGIVLVAILTAYLFLSKSKKMRFQKNPILIWAVFMTTHDVFMLPFVDKGQSVFVNSLIGSVVFLMGTLVIGGVVDFKRFRGSLNWVSLLCMVGMVYHFSLAIRGMSFSPIQLPFMPEQEVTNRVFEEIDRPTSFFMEPQSYVSYMLIPLFLALEERKWLWTGLIAITIFMSSSTTGLLIVFILFGLMMFMGGSAGTKTTWATRIIMSVLGVGMLFFLMRSNLFEQGMERTMNKNENIEDEIRLVQGPVLVMNMEISDLPLGIPYANAYQYAIARGLSDQIIIYGDNSVFVPTLWLCLLRFGIIGLILYLYIYWYYFKRNKAIEPYIICLAILLVTNPDFVGASFLFEFIFIMSHHRYYLSNEKKIYLKA